MRTLIEIADRLHASARQVRVLAWFAWCVRVLLAIAFLPSGLTKALDHPFTRMDPETNSVGRMFFVLQHDFGGLYPFIGMCQLAAAVLLLVPATTLVGALVHLPVTAGIVVITTTMGFEGTWVITCLMLLGVVYLICWDWHRVKPLVDPDLRVPARVPAP